MSNILGKVPFYPVPQALVNSGKFKRLSEGAHKLYQLILFSAQKYSSAVVMLSNREIREAAGLSPNTIRRGRTELWEAQLIDMQQVPGGHFTYLVLNPLTGVPPAGAKLKHWRSDAVTPTPSASSPIWAQLTK